MADVGPPIALIAVGLILWLAITATIAGISIQTIGLILFLIGVVWLVIELAINAAAAHRRDARARGRPPGRPRARSALAGAAANRFQAFGAVWTDVRAAPSRS